MLKMSGTGIPDPMGLRTWDEDTGIRTDLWDRLLEVKPLINHLIAVCVNCFLLQYQIPTNLVV